ncbi:hypothetical protein Tco_0086729 [Tanacetum coccineum]
MAATSSPPSTPSHSRCHHHHDHLTIVIISIRTPSRNEAVWDSSTIRVCLVRCSATRKGVVGTTVPNKGAFGTAAPEWGVLV